MVIDRREHDESHYELFYAPKPRKDHEYIHGDSVIAIEISALGLEIESQRQSSVHLVFAPMAAFSFLSSNSVVGENCIGRGGGGTEEKQTSSLYFYCNKLFLKSNNNNYYHFFYNNKKTNNKTK